MLRQSKIQIPRGAGAQLPRPALCARMRAALAEHRFALVCAPAGCGKTSVLAELALQWPAGASAWVSVDSGDDLGLLIEALIAALEKFDLPWRVAASGLVAQAADGIDLAGLADALALALDASDPSDALIVIDDWQLCDDPRATDWLGAFMDRLPGHWRLALGTRDEPTSGLGLARRRARREVVEFNRADLAFGEVEVMSWAKMAGWTDTRQLPSLAKAVQGWPAALQLALAASEQGLPSATADERLFDFVAVEVVDRLPAALRRFMLRSSVLPELHVSRAQAVCDDADAASHLAQIRRRGLFVSEVDDRGTLRLHDLFRRALRHQLEREESRLVPELLRRAALGERDPLQRVTWLLEAGACEDAAAELAASSAALITDGASARVAQALLGFAESARLTWPHLAVVQAQLAWADWDFDRMLRVLDRVRRDRICEPDAGLDDLLKAYRVVALDSTHRDTECAEVMAQLRDRPLSALPLLLLRITELGMPRSADDSDTGRCLAEIAQLADRIGTADAWYQAIPATNLMLLPGTVEVFQQMAALMHKCTGDEPTPLRAWANVLHAWAALGAGDTRRALGALERAEDDARWNDHYPPVLQEAHLLRALLHAIWGHHELAWRSVQASIETLPARALPALGDKRRAELALERRLRIAMVLGDAVALRGLIADVPGPPGEPSLQPLLHQVALGAWHATQGHGSQARAAWGELLPELHRLAGRGLAAELRLRLAAIQTHDGLLEAAVATLLPLLYADHAQGETGPAVLAGPAVMQILAANDWQGRLDGRAQGLLSSWREAAERAATPPLAEAATAGLSPRELEVLQCIAQGDSNKQIARTLGLSTHTVKRHVANILDKLDLRSRGQAAAWHHAGESR